MRAARWLAGRIARLVPETLLARLLPARYRYDPAQLPVPPIPPDAPIRLFVAPVNWAGQGWQWARAAERELPDVASVSMAYTLPGDFRFPSDNLVPVGAYAISSRWQRAQKAAVTDGFTHVLLEAVRRPFGAILDETVVGQVRELLAQGVQVALVCHGSEIRLPSRHLRSATFSPFADLPADRRIRLERVVARNAAIVEALSLPTFVSTPDLLADLPTATWMPVIVEPTRWASDTVPLNRAVPIVAHAPSKGHIKGSDLIDPVMDRLAEEGLIEYRRVSSMTSDEMVGVYRDADIVLDQFRIGSYGVAACEAMAAGRVVVGHVAEGTRAVAAAAAGVALPVVEANPVTIEAVVRGILNDRETARAAAASGPGFVATVHDGRMSAAALSAFLTAH